MGKTRIALLGFGTVGTGVWNILSTSKGEIEANIGEEIEIAKILVKNIGKRRRVEVPPGILTTDFEEILKDTSIKVIVEVIGGMEPTLDYIKMALESGRHVVTANKLLISKFGSEILRLAAENSVNLRYEASVCGGIPLINVIKESLSVERINEVAGILNGTTNYILSKMTDEGCSFETALAEAQAKGFAEADPTSDVEGFDALYKLRILSKLVFGVETNEDLIFREGITNITKDDISHAKELGYKIKLLAAAKRSMDKIVLRVAPTLVPEKHFLAGVGDCFNAVFLKGAAVGELIFYGKGAGELPTGSAVVSDIVGILRNKSTGQKDRKSTVDISCQTTEWSKSKYFVRFSMNNKTYDIQKLISVFESGNSRVSKMLKVEEAAKTSNVLLIISEADTLELRKALAKLEATFESVKGLRVLRVEDFEAEEFNPQILDAGNL